MLVIRGLIFGGAYIFGGKFVLVIRGAYIRDFTVCHISCHLDAKLHTHRYCSSKVKYKKPRCFAKKREKT